MTNMRYEWSPFAIWNISENSSILVLPGLSKWKTKLKRAFTVLALSFLKSFVEFQKYVSAGSDLQ